MKIIGITGGIGSGKSTVAKVLSTIGYPVYNSDLAGKKAYEHSEIKTKVIDLLGNNILNSEDTFNFGKIASLVFADKNLLLKLNAIIHPFVKADFKSWCDKQQSTLVFKESALLIESGAAKECDFVVTVIADKELRINRLLQRDKHSTKESIEARIKEQLSDSERIKNSNFTIDNSNQLIVPQIIQLLTAL